VNLSILTDCFEKNNSPKQWLIDCLLPFVIESGNELK